MKDWFGPGSRADEVLIGADVQGLLQQLAYPYEIVDFRKVDGEYVLCAIDAHGTRFIVTNPIGTNYFMLSVNESGLPELS